MFGFSDSRIKELEKHIKFFQSLDLTDVIILKEKELQRDMNEWLERAEIIWRQKSRELWLSIGDCYSKIFPHFNSSNIMRIFIAAIKAEDGTWLDPRYEINNHICDWFSILFKACDFEPYPIFD